MKGSASTLLVRAGHFELALGNMETGSFACRRLAAKVVALPAFRNGLRFQGGKASVEISPVRAPSVIGALQRRIFSSGRTTGSIASNRPCGTGVMKQKGSPFSNRTMPGP